METKQYPIYIGSGVLTSLKELKSFIKSDQVLVVSNQSIADLYLGQVTDELADYQLIVHLIPDGESFKSLETYNDVIETLLRNGFRRNATIIALGGGVVGDLAGFVAATYQRGIPFIQVPTSLLAMVDSSVGGKTAVNHPLAKNMIGAFYQPEAVFADISTLTTLPEKQFAAGMAEVIKYGLIYDFSLFEYIESHCQAILNHDIQPITYMVSECCRIKAEIVNLDEKEQGIRAILNLGHTFGHALERLGDYKKLLHGEAVAIGMLMALDLSVRLNKVGQDYYERVKKLLSLFNLPTRVFASWSAKDIFGLMKLDKKNTSDQITLIIPSGLGKVEIIDSVAQEDILKSIECFLPGSNE